MRFTTAWPNPQASNRCREIPTESGRLVILETDRPPSARKKTDFSYCVVFPGFTGDALSHRPFIEAALHHGMGVVCVTPKWANSVKRMRENIENLLASLEQGPVPLDRIHYVRAVSFGCWLSFPWIQRLSQSLKKIAWVTPCSHTQLPEAGRRIGVDVVNDDPREGIEGVGNKPVRVLALREDLIVPHIDARFLAVSPEVDLRWLVGSNDHFTAGDLPEASTQIAQWFGHEVQQDL